MNPDLLDPSTMTRLRSALTAMLATRGHHGAPGDTDSLFVSGKLDSLAATELIVLLESDFGMDLSSADFDISALDSLAEIAALIARRPA